MQSLSAEQLAELAIYIKQQAKALGFQQAGISDLELSDAQANFEKWLAAGYQGDMSYLERNQELRFHPEQLHPGSLRAISVRMDYLPESAQFADNLQQDQSGYISRYALGRDYHKLIRKKLKQLGQAIEAYCDDKLSMRPFVDSAPVLERQIATKAGLGWTGKHSLLINPTAGSWFFLGELFIDLPLPIDQPIEEQCGSCIACKTICPTDAIVAPYTVDARRCISYLTIEHSGAIPLELRPLIGNRIYGCDDCQLVCPWNRFSSLTEEADFNPRDGLKQRPLLELFAWTEEHFLNTLVGSPIRRIGHIQWLRNIAIAIGNASYKPENVAALEAFEHPDEMLMEHVAWALEQQRQQQASLTKKTQRLIRVVEKGLPRDA